MTGPELFKEIKKLRRRKPIVVEFKILKHRHLDFITNDITITKTGITLQEKKFDMMEIELFRKIGELRRKPVYWYTKKKKYIQTWK